MTDGDPRSSFASTVNLESGSLSVPPNHGVARSDAEVRKRNLRGDPSEPNPASVLVPEPRSLNAVPVAFKGECVPVQGARKSRERRPVNRGSASL